MSTHHLDLVRKLVGTQSARKRALDEAIERALAERAAQRSLKSGGTLRRLGRLAEAELKSRAETVLDTVRRVGALRPTPIAPFVRSAQELAETMLLAAYAQVWAAVTAPTVVKQLQREVPNAVQAIEWELSTVRNEEVERVRAEIGMIGEEARVDGGERHTPGERRQKLVAVVAVDIAGYSTMAERDEVKAVSDAVRVRALVEHIAQPLGGRMFGSAGDGFMLEFSSCARAIEAAFELSTKCLPKVRVGVHAGDVEFRPDGDLLGHTVNVAERVRALASPGTAFVSVDARRMTRTSLRMVSRGVHRLAKMEETMELFELTQPD